MNKTNRAAWSRPPHAAVRVPPTPSAARTFLLAAALLALPLTPAAAQQKLPSPEKIVGDYVKAVGGKKRLAALRDATYELSLRGEDGSESRLRVLTKAPASSRTELWVGEIELVSASDGRTAWRRSPAAGVETLTGEGAHAAKLRAMLGGGRLLDYKRKGVLARTAGVEQVGGEKAYVVEFSRKEGGRVRYWFGASSRLLLKTADTHDGGSAYLYGDYRPVNGVLEPHRAVYTSEGRPDRTYTLLGVRHNTGLADALFEPPGDAGLDVAALLRELARNQDEVDRRVNDYTFTRRVTERKVNDRGEVTEEKRSVYEVYPVVNYRSVMKLVSEDGVPLSPERAAKEERRVAEELAKGEREGPKNAERRARRKAEREARRQREGKGDDPEAADDDDHVGVSTFLRVCEFISPRRERLREREVIVFDFRPRPGFRPSTRAEKVVSKLAGTVWIDEADRHVMRLESRLIDSYKVGGGLLASIRSGSAFVFEQTRMADGVWLPRFTQMNLSAKVFLFAGMSVNRTNEFDDYKLFSTRAGEATLAAPKPDGQ